MFGNDLGDRRQRRTGNRDLLVMAIVLAHRLKLGREFVSNPLDLGVQNIHLDETIPIVLRRRGGLPRSRRAVLREATAGRRGSPGFRGRS